MRDFTKSHFLLHGESFWLEGASPLLITRLVFALFAPDCPAENVALNKPATASAVYAPYGPEQAVDGDVITKWNAPGQGTPGSPQWLKVDLEAVIPIYRIILVGPSTSGYEGYSVVYELYGSVDDTNWTQLGTGTLVDTTDPVDVVYPGGRGILYIRYDVVGGSHWANLEELEAYPPVRITDITRTNNTVQLTLTNCLSDVTNVVERTFDLTMSNSWTAVTNLAGAGASPQWAETISNTWTSGFYRVTTLQGSIP